MNAIRLENRLEKRPCIWMQASAVHRKFCTINYDCPACRFDRALRRVCDENKRLQESGQTPRGKKGRLVFWKDKLKAQPHWKRPCIHHLKGRIDFRACNREYMCGDCEFDQYFSDQYTVHAVVRPVEFINIEGMKIPHGFYLHKGHTWLKVEENSEVRVGIDDFALRLLGPLDQIEAPLVGKTLKQDRLDIKMNRGGLDADVLSPVSGVVTAINPKLRERGSLANRDPYADGWVLRAHSKNLRKDLQHLMIGSETEDFYKEEVDRLHQVIESEVGPLTADGGQLGNDIYGNIPQVGWDRLVRLFLHR
ncbi:MAG: glycine cleavage system protein H [Desulfobacterales bacterium]|nr:MAG: glycine cleavage system protein H [Desulfobacterales bacterium]